MGFTKRHPTSIIVTEGLLDTACVFGAGVFAARLTAPEVRETWAEFADHLSYFIGFVVAWWAAAAGQRLFASRRSENLSSQISDVVKAVALSTVFSGFFDAFVTGRSLDHSYLLSFAACALVLLAAFRSMVRLSLWHVRRRGYNTRQILIAGANERARHLVEVMARHGRYGYQLMGALDDDAERVTCLAEYDVPYLGKLGDLERVLMTHVIDEVYVCLPVRGYYEQITSMAHLCEGIGTPIRMIADLFPLRVATSRARQLEDIPLLSLSTVPEAPVQLLTKRFMDLVVSSAFLLAVAWWLFPVLAVLIKWDSRGPVFFLQERVGLNQRRFRMIKFRSMVADAEQIKHRLAALNEADGPVFKIREDPRITRVGRWLRRFSLDELPQFINVFLGHMSLVGPRPPVPEEVKQYTWNQRRRLSVRPGVTGLQQISGRSDLDFKRWIEFDLAYIDNWSLMEDLRILFRTIGAVVLARGAA